MTEVKRKIRRIKVLSEEPIKEKKKVKRIKIRIDNDETPIYRNINRNKCDYETKEGLTKIVNRHLNSFYLDLEEKKRLGITPEPADFKVSTMSAACTLSYKLDIDLLFNYISQNLTDKIIGMQYGKKEVGKIKKKKKRDLEIESTWTDDVPDNCKRLQNRFYNSSFVIIKEYPDVEPINMKIFMNGGVSMAGCKRVEDGYNAVNILLNHIRKCPEIYNADAAYKGNPDELKVTDYKITLINSGYYAGFRLDGTKFQDIIMDKYDLFASFDPLIYPGVKISYMWNNKKEDNDGRCNCSTLCINKKGECKEITIAVFGSGKIIITGANTKKQLDDSFNFISTVLRRHYFELIRFCINDYIDMNSPMFKKRIKQIVSKK